MNAFWAVLHRDLLLALRRKTEVLTGVFFFVVVASLFPLAIGPEPQTLRHIGPGVLWVGALLSTMLGLNRLFEGDWRDGSLEHMLLSPHGLGLIVLGKILAHWLLCGVPLVILAPVLGLQFDLSAQALSMLALSLLLGTPVLSCVGAIGAALTLGVRGGGVLISLLVLPLFVPVLVFGTTAAQGGSQGGSRHEGVGIGVKGGHLYSSFKEASESLDSNQGFLAGIFFGGNRPGVVGVMGKLLYVKRGSKDSTGKLKVDTKYLEIPVLARINVGSSSLNGVLGYVIVGPSFDILLKADSQGLDVKKNYQSLDLGLQFGGGIEIWFAYVLALGFLLVRPQGLFGEKIIDRV